MGITIDEATDAIARRSIQVVGEAIKKRGHDRPPFLATDYADILRVTKIVRTDLGELGGALLRYADGSFIIKVNGTHLPTRQNFSCAHEMGHILLSELRLESCLSETQFRTRRFNPQKARTSRNKARERLCDVAASELLMPEDVFKRYLSEISIARLEQLAKMFGTSIQATAMRIAELSPTPCVALLWKPPKAGNCKTLRLAWHVGPGRRSSSRKGRYLPVTRAAVTGALVFEAFEGGKVVRSCKEFETGSEVHRLQMESKAYGSADARYVVSLASRDRR